MITCTILHARGSKPFHFYGEIGRCLLSRTYAVVHYKYAVVSRMYIIVKYFNLHVSNREVGHFKN